MYGLGEKVVLVKSAEQLRVELGDRTPSTVLRKGFELCHQRSGKGTISQLRSLPLRSIRSKNLSAASKRYRTTVAAVQDHENITRGFFYCPV